MSGLPAARITVCRMISSGTASSVPAVPHTHDQKLIETSQPYIDEWIQRADAAGLDGKTLVEEYKTLIAQFTKERDEKGYPWAPKG